MAALSRRKAVGAGVLALVALAVTLALIYGTGWTDRGRPPRTDDSIVVEPTPSLVTVPVEAELGNLARALEQHVPRELWRINEPDQVCIESEGVDLGIATVKTPRIKCNIVGEVTRGAIRVGGSGKELRFSFPITAVVRAEDIGGILKRKTATAKAMANAVVRIELEKDWTPRGTVRLSYDWLTEPHVKFLGQTISLTEPAERELAPIIARLERELPGELGRIGIKRQIEQAWASAFTSVVLNERNPEVWMRITPRALQYGGYEVTDGHLRLRLGMRALTETYVGHRPEPRTPVALPPMQALDAEPGELSFFLPVFADYRALEPVLIRALRKRSRRPFMVPGLEPVDATFKAATIYGTSGGRIAVGLNFSARERGSKTATSGTVWMTGKPVNAEDSRKVGFTDFGVTGTTDMTGGDLILDLINAPGVAPMIAEMLAQNFERDYAELLGKIDQAIEAKRAGDVIIHADLTRAKTGQLQAAGAGLYLPVWASGTASVTIVP
jgi:hypothetical protein